MTEKWQIFIVFFVAYVNYAAASSVENITVVSFNSKRDPTGTENFLTLETGVVTLLIISISTIVI